MSNFKNFDLIEQYVSKNVKSKGLKTMPKIIAENIRDQRSNSVTALSDLVDIIRDFDKVLTSDTAIPHFIHARFKLLLASNYLVSKEGVDLSGYDATSIADSMKSTSYKEEDYRKMFDQLQDICGRLELVKNVNDILQNAINNMDVQTDQRYILPIIENGEYVYRVFSAVDSAYGQRVLLKNRITHNKVAMTDFAQQYGVDESMIWSLQELSQFYKECEVDVKSVLKSFKTLKNNVVLALNEIMISSKAEIQELSIDKENTFGTITQPETSYYYEWKAIDKNEITETVENSMQLNLESLYILNNELSRETNYYTRDDMRLAMLLAEENVNKNQIRAFFRCETMGLAAILCKCFSASNGMIYKSNKVSAETADFVISSFFVNPDDMIKMYQKNITGTRYTSISTLQSETKLAIKYIIMKMLKDANMIHEDIAYKKLDEYKFLNDYAPNLNNINQISLISGYEMLMESIPHLNWTGDKVQASKLSDSISSIITHNFIFEPIEDNLIESLRSVVARVGAYIFKQLHLYPAGSRDKFEEPTFKSLCSCFNIVSLALNNPAIYTLSPESRWSREDEIVLSILNNKKYFEKLNIKDMANYFTIDHFHDPIQGKASLAAISYKVANPKNAGIYTIHTYGNFTRYLQTEKLSILNKAFQNVTNVGFGEFFNSLLSESIGQMDPYVNNPVLLRVNVGDNLLKLFVMSQADRVYVDYAGNMKYYFSNRNFLNDPNMRHLDLQYVTSDLNVAAFYAIFKNKLKTESQLTFARTAENISPTKFYADIRNQYYTAKLIEVSNIEGYFMSKDVSGKLCFVDFKADLGLHNFVRTNATGSVMKVIIDKRHHAHLSIASKIVEQLTKLGDFIVGVNSNFKSTKTFDLIKGEIDFYPDECVNRTLNTKFKQLSHNLYSVASNDYADIGLVEGISLSVYKKLIDQKVLSNIDYVNGYQSMDRLIIHAIKLAAGKTMLSMAVNTIYAASQDSQKELEKKEILTNLDLMLKAAIVYAYENKTIVNSTIKEM